MYLDKGIVINVSEEAWLREGDKDEQLEGKDEHEGSVKGPEVVMVTSVGGFSRFSGASLVETGGVILLVRLLTLTWRFSRQVEILERQMLLSRII